VRESANGQRALARVLDQQAATAEILRVISNSPTDLEPVFGAILRSAIQLSGALVGGIYRFEGGLIHLSGLHGLTPEAVRIHAQQFPQPPTRGLVAGRAILDGTLSQMPDALEDLEFQGKEFARAGGWRSSVSVPMLRNGRPIGAISVARAEPGLFPDTIVLLLQTFADQAVIAIENARLFKELEVRNVELIEALAQQTATADILRSISASPRDYQPVFDTIVRNAGSVCGAVDAVLWTADGDELVVRAHHGPIAATIGARQPVGGSVAGRAVIEARVVHVENLAEADDFPVGRDIARRLGWRTTLSVPLLREGAAVGAILIRRSDVRLFTPKEIALLQTFADQAVIAIENVRLFTELEARNAELTEALERQTATAEILRAISASTTDVQPVFEAIAENAVRLSGALFGSVYRIDGELIHVVADHNYSPAALEFTRRSFPTRPSRQTFTGRAILERAVVHVPDVSRDRERLQARDVAEVVGFRSVLSVPMLRDGNPIGAITVFRDAVGPFSDKHIALLQTFADQAVIAIENARLLTELQARTGELQRSVGQLTALGEVGQAVSSSLDLETVLTTIVSRAVAISGLDGGTVFEYDAETEQFVQRAVTGTARVLPSGRAVVGKGEGVMGRTAATLEPVQVPNIAVDGTYEGRLREALIAFGVRAILAVPIIRDGRLLGGLAVNRNQPGEFPAETVDLLRTFATQSALAIQNARLFQQLDRANRHKSEFLASMSHELRTPLNAIIGYSEMLQEEATDLGQPGLLPDLTKISAAGKHLLELINAVLDLSKIEAGKMEVYLERFAVPPLVEEIAAVVRPLADRKGNALMTSCAPEVGEMRADQTKVRQTLFNLLSNACKFTEGGTVSLRVRRGWSPKRGAEEIVFEVADTGIGMSEEQVSRLFQDFSQADASTAKKYGGTGLGLALSRRLCRMMGGDIAVRSEAGRGSTFTARLPVEVEEHVAPEVAAAPAPGTGSPETTKREKG
jgi:two-component system, NtrC family, sensor kinase